ncbi:MAG: hypothetical protein L0216_01790 [Planctomycetales bacterium]|nr:hypothetical protein [Planctomycetales bacterium]
MQFYIVYIHEAHPVDGWRMPQNDSAGIKVTDPKTEQERQAVASDCVKSLKLTLPCLLDNVENTTDKAYGGWPDRLYVIGHDGKVAYKGDPGPRGFTPPAWQEAIQKAVAAAPPPPPPAPEAKPTDGAPAPEKPEKKDEPKKDEKAGS